MKRHRLHIPHDDGVALETIMLPLLAADLFGERDYEKTPGVIVSVSNAGFAIGVPADEPEP